MESKVVKNVIKLNQNFYSDLIKNCIVFYLRRKTL